MLVGVVRSIWDEPAVPDRPKRTRWDWLLLPGIALVGVLEVFDQDVTWRFGALPVALAAVVLLWRRRADPFPVAISLLAMSGGVAMAMVVAGVDGGYDGGYGSAGLAILVGVYSLVRWGSGRDIVLGLGLVVPVAVVTTVASREADAVVSVLFWGFPILFGALVRSRRALAAARLTEARLSERRRIAREPHDSVAHHVSAMAVQAKVAQALLVDNPEGALEAMHTVEEQASTTLGDMRRMVGALRDEIEGPGGTGEPLHPFGGLADIARLGDDSQAGPVVEVELVGDLDRLSPSTEAGLFRLAQESITNTRRHAKRATRIDVRIVGSPVEVALTVVDDGDPVVDDAPATSGYGLVGMHERAALLGGTFESGPGERRGWAMSAILPKNGQDR